MSAEKKGAERNDEDRMRYDVRADRGALVAVENEGWAIGRTCARLDPLPAGTPWDAYVRQEWEKYTHNRRFDDVTLAQRAFVQGFGRGYAIGLRDK
jgi:hypothetical protein